MTLGLLLARAGIEVTVLEKHGDFIRDFRGDTVHPSTLRMLDDLGLGADFARLPIRELEQMRIRIGAATVVIADFRRIPGRHKHIAIVPQWDFLDLLASAAAAEPSFVLRTNCEVTSLRRNSSGRVTGVVYRDEADVERELAADLTVACDGRGSVVRADSGLPGDSTPIPMDVWQVRVPKGESTIEGEIFGVFGGGRAGIVLDRGEYYHTAYLVAKGTDERVREQGLDAFRDALGEMFGWSARTVSAIRSWDDVKVLRTEMTLLRRWYGNGVLCLGDAAHTMSPVGGVGVNLAVQDAVAAARILAGPLLGTGRVGESDLAKVQRRRAWPAWVMQRTQRGEHETLIRPALAGTLDERRLPRGVRALRAVPALRGLTAYLGGVGVRTESVPAFAVRR